MHDPIDKLLSELNAEQKPSPPSASPASASADNASSNSSSNSSNLPPAQSASSGFSGSIDDLLQQIGEDSKRTVRSALSQRAHSQPPPAFPRSAATQAAPAFADRARDVKADRPAPADAALLNQIKTQYEMQDQAIVLQQQQAQQAAEQQRQQQEREQQRRREQLRLHRRAELTEQAQQWLKKISPKSEEGLWFEEFACGYESRLEAAIDYLEALQEVKSTG